MSARRQVRITSPELQALLRDVGAQINEQSVAALERLGYSETDAREYLVLPGSVARAQRDLDRVQADARAVGEGLGAMAREVYVAFNALAEGFRAAFGVRS